MENASKAILISAGILIGIMLISVTMVVWNNVKNSSQSIDNQKKANVANEQVAKFTQYVGDIKGIEVKNSIRRVLSYNENNNENIIYVYVRDNYGVVQSFSTIQELINNNNYIRDDVEAFISGNEYGLLDYIGKNDIYIGNLTQNKDGTINNLTFTLKELIDGSQMNNQIGIRRIKSSSK